MSYLYWFLTILFGFLTIVSTIALAPVWFLVTIYMTKQSFSEMKYHIWKNQ